MSPTQIAIQKIIEEVTAPLHKEIADWKEIVEDQNRELLSRKVQLDRLRQALEKVADWAQSGPTVARDIALRALNGNN